MQYQLTEESELEISVAYKWYESKRKGLGVDFLLVVEAAFGTLVRNPKLYPIRHASYRVAPVRRFPYLVVYEMLNEEIFIYAVFHTSRSVGKLLKRLEDTESQE